MNKTLRQVQRMLALVPYLQLQEGVPVDEVAAEFGVSARQIRQDLNLLMFTGVGEYPGELIDFDQYALDDGIIHIRDAEFMARPFRLTTSEGIALIVALRTLRASAGASQIPIIDSALAKLESAVSGNVDTPVDIHVDVPDPEIHQLLETALREGRRVEITYATASRDEETERAVDPIRLFTERGRIYLQAWCLSAQDLRLFRLDRIRAAILTDIGSESHSAEPYELPEGLFHIAEDAFWAILDLSPDARWFTDYYPVSEVEERGEGILRVKIYSADSSWLRRLAMRYSNALTVIEPLSLAEEVLANAMSALSAYDGTRSSSKE